MKKRISLVILLFTLVCQYVHAKNQKALSLDGDGDYVEILDNPSLNFGATDNLTLEVWVKLLSDDAIVLSKRVATKNEAYSIQISGNTHQVDFFVRDKSGQLTRKLSE
tara:strand:+ start:553 stop:876 length:324 start_codon:yes stop_codon:yes gene_type:complete